MLCVVLCVAVVFHHLYAPSWEPPDTNMAEDAETGKHGADDCKSIEQNESSGNCLKDKNSFRMVVKESPCAEKQTKKTSKTVSFHSATSLPTERKIASGKIRC